MEKEILWNKETRSHTPRHKSGEITATYEKKNKLFYEEDHDIYDDEYIEELLEDDEISPEEEAFMIGYMET